MKTERARQVCLRCESEFGAPHLGDFVYGAFLLWSGSGSACAYLNTFEAPEFDEVSGMIGAILGARDAYSASSVQRVFGEIAADLAPDGTAFSILHYPTCPDCGASDDRIIDGAIAHPAAEVDVVTFRRWNAMNDQEKHDRVRMVLSKHGRSMARRSSDD